jgi:pyruvate dehydrogenase E1 component alpha subunit
VAVGFFGDGASNTGSFHESLNIAASWKLPVIYVCEHNGWAANTSAQMTHAQDDVAGRAAGYGMPGIVVDGNDVMAVYEAASQAVARARAGEGPTLLECKTYRHRNHTERPGAVDARPAEEIASWMARDPIPLLIEQLKEQQGQFSDGEFQAMDGEILAAVEDAVTFAKASPFPKPEAALDDVFAD